MVEEILIKNNTQQSEFAMDKLTTKDYILHTVDFGEVPVDYITNKFLNQFGSTVSHFNVSERAIEIIGNIIASSEAEMSERKMFLNKFFNPLESFTLKYKNYTIDCKLENTIKYTIDEKDNNEVVCNFKINAIAHYPLFLQDQSTKEVMAGYQPAFHFPLILREELDNKRQYGVIFGKNNLDTTQVIISNSGDVEIGMQFEIRAVGGMVINPKIENIVTGEFLKINKTLADGEVIKINTSIGSKSIIGSTDGGNTFVNYFAYKSLDSSWLQLRKGANTFVYDSDFGSPELQIDVQYTSAFMEVQQCF